MQNFQLQDFLSIKPGTLIAGLLGAFITMIRKTEGSLQARITGYLIAIIAVIYLVPFLIYFSEVKFNIVLHQTAEHLLSFIFGMLAQSVTESFIDSPAESVYRWAAGFKRMKRVIWNGETLYKTDETNPTKPSNISEDK